MSTNTIALPFQEVRNQSENPLMGSIRKGFTAIIVSGNVHDLHMEKDCDDLYYRPIYLADELHQEGFLVLLYSRSEGLKVFRRDQFETANLHQVMDRSGLGPFLAHQRSHDSEVVSIFRGIKKLLSAANKRQIAVLVDHVSHLTSNQSPTVEEQIVAEVLCDCANLPSLKKFGNLIIGFTHEPNAISPLLHEFHRLSYPYPSVDDYHQLVEILQKRPDYLAPDIPSDEIARLARGLKLKELAELFDESKFTGIPIDRSLIMAKKSTLIEQASQKTLKVKEVVSTFEDMAGLEVLKSWSKVWSSLLRNQDSRAPRALLLAGPPGTGKSTIAEAFAHACGFNLLEMAQVKSKWVGESERLLAKALEMIEALHPVVLFIDEIDQQFKNRSETSLDGGVSQHFLAELFKFAARDDLRGKVIILGCSNTPQLLDPAMIDRFVTIPVLEATPPEMTKIFPKIERRITGQETIDPEDKDVLEASKVLYYKGANPRQMFEIINHALSGHQGDLSPQKLLQASVDYRSNFDVGSRTYSSLSALALTAFSSYFPWASSPATYPYPHYLENMVDKETGELDAVQLNAKISEYKQLSRF